MTKYAVAYISFFENELKVEIIEANGWKEALSKHSMLLDEDGNPGDIEWLPEDMEEAKIEANNADMAFDVKEI